MDSEWKDLFDYQAIRISRKDSPTGVFSDVNPKLCLISNRSFSLATFNAMLSMAKATPAPR